MTQLIRIYLPLDMPDLRALQERGVCPAGPRTAYAVTERLRAAEPAEDSEGLEYLATQDAATDAAARSLRVIAAVDLDDDEISQGPEAGSACAVEVSAALQQRHIASFHVLDPAGERDVDVDFELSWYDATELALVLQTVG